MYKILQPPVSGCWQRTVVPSVETRLTNGVVNIDLTQQAFVVNVCSIVAPRPPLLFLLLLARYSHQPTMNLPTLKSVNFCSTDQSVKNYTKNKHLKSKDKHHSSGKDTAL